MTSAKPRHTNDDVIDAVLASQYAKQRIERAYRRLEARLTKQAKAQPAQEQEQAAEPVQAA